MEVEKLMNDHTLLFLTETQQQFGTQVIKKYINMTDTQSKK